MSVGLCHDPYDPFQLAHRLSCIAWYAFLPLVSITQLLWKGPTALRACRRVCIEAADGGSYYEVKELKVTLQMSVTHEQPFRPGTRAASTNRT